MGKKIIISEEERKNILEKHSEPKEGIFTPVKSMYQGLKGVWRGEGYDYYKYVSSLRTISRKLKKLDEPNHKIMNDLNSLKNKVNISKMDPTKKQNLVDSIDKAIQHFNAYAGLIDKIDQIASNKLS